MPPDGRLWFATIPKPDVLQDNPAFCFLNQCISPAVAGEKGTPWKNF
jgi:hypothetical protein